MSEENVEIIRRVYDALNRNDWDAAFRDAHPKGHLLTIREGTILSLTGYPNPDEALEAAGLSE
jgi:ketosteroid isomerase-like protein